jgi:hypothetical protein
MKCKTVCMMFMEFAVYRSISATAAGNARRLQWSRPNSPELSGCPAGGRFVAVRWLGRRFTE